MDVERKTLIDETEKAMERVSPSSWALMQGLIISAKQRSRDGLIEGCHRAVQRLLMFEIIIMLF